MIDDHIEMILRKVINRELCIHSLSLDQSLLKEDSDFPADEILFDTLEELGATKSRLRYLIWDGTLRGLIGIVKANLESRLAESQK